jgi:hypothetical protein
MCTRPPVAKGKFCLSCKADNGVVVSFVRVCLRVLQEVSALGQPLHLQHQHRHLVEVRISPLCCCRLSSVHNIVLLKSTEYCKIIQIP